MFSQIDSTPLSSTSMPLSDVLLSQDPLVLTASSKLNVFATPWKKSDVVLVVDEMEFHLHRSILSMQSPVFDKMLNGSFKEATQEKITIEGKDADKMLQFLKLLYPPNMIKAPQPQVLFKIFPEIVPDILAIADEYQADDVVSQCVTEITITPRNVFEILPYADKYNKSSIHKQCIEIITRNVALDILEEELDALGETLTKETLLAKCHFLQSIAKNSHGAVLNLLEMVIEKTDGRDQLCHNLPGCSHKISVNSFRKAKNCENCLRGYKKFFINKFTEKMNTKRYYGYVKTLGGDLDCDQFVKDLDDVEYSISQNKPDETDQSE